MRELPDESARGIEGVRVVVVGQQEEVHQVHEVQQKCDRRRRHWTALV